MFFRYFSTICNPILADRAWTFLVASDSSLEHLSFLFRPAVASVDCFRILRSGTGRGMSLLRLKQSAVTLGSWWPRVQHRWHRDLVVVGWQSGRSWRRLHCPQATGKSKWLLLYLSIQLKPHMHFSFLSNLSLFKHMEQDSKSGKQECCQTVYRKECGRKKKKGKAWENAAKKPW